MGVLVVDVGSSSVRASVVQPDGTVAHVHAEPVVTSSPAPSFVEVDASSIATSVLSVARATLADAGAVEGVGIADQRATTVLWDRSSGEPVGPAISWQDLRTVVTCLMLRDQGVLLAPNESATKLAFLLDLADPERARDLCFGTVDSWIAWTLSSGALHVTDATNAAVTGLRTPDGKEWDPRVLDALRIPESVLPEVVDSSGAIGEASALEGSPPICGIVGDQQASLVGQGCTLPGLAKITFGTGGFLDSCVGPDRPTFARRGRGGTFPIAAWQRSGRITWGVEAIMLSAGSCIDWLRDDLGLIETAADTDGLAASVADSGDTWFVPAFFGIGTPVWDFGARGAFVGITRGTGQRGDGSRRLRGDSPPRLRPGRGCRDRHGNTARLFAGRRRDVSERHVPPGSRRFLGPPSGSCAGDRVHDSRSCLHGGNGVGIVARRERRCVFVATAPRGRPTTRCQPQTSIEGALARHARQGAPDDPRAVCSSVLGRVNTAPKGRPEMPTPKKGIREHEGIGGALMSRSARFLVVGLMCAALGGPLFATAGASAAPTQVRNTTFGPPEPPGWSTAQTIDPRTGAAVTVACASANFCVATDAIDGVSRWNGASWSAPTNVDTPPSGAHGLAVVSCPSSSFCMLVDNSANDVTWNGTSWSAPTKFSVLGNPVAVSCPDSTFCVAANGTGSLLSYNGSTWSTMTVPAGDLAVGVTCTSHTSCTAVSTNGTVLVFNGTTWTAHTSPGAPTFASEPGEVSCPTTGFCAVGFSESLSTWNGSKWTVKDDTAENFTAVSCASATSCVAVDTVGDATTWNGSAWGSAHTADLFAYAPFASVSCPSTTSCTALDSTGHTVRYNGSTWTAPVVALQIGGSIVGVSCPDNLFCAAIDSEGGTLTWNGINWSKVTTVDQKRLFSSISCTSSTFCIAFDEVGDTFRFNGSTWSGPTAVLVQPQQVYLSCVSSTFCVAVPATGGTPMQFDGTSWKTTPGWESGFEQVGVSCVSRWWCMSMGADGLTQLWTGSGWVFGGGTFTQPRKVSCASSSFCAAVDLDGMAQTWDEGIWSNPVSVDPGQNLTQVDCGGIAFCVALDTVGNEVTYTGTWSAPDGLDGAPVNRANAADSVSCPDESFCTAVTADGAALTYEHAYGPDASYFMAASDGEVFAFGSAQSEGSVAGAVLARPVVGMANTADGGGYWLVASDGGIFSFGDAAYHGSMGGRYLYRPVVGMASTPDGKGYWLVASDGGVFSFGTAKFHGSMGGRKLNKPIVGIASTADGGGYWLVASDGGIFAFGDAKYLGSMGGRTLNKPVVGMNTTPNGMGYWLAASDGGVFSFGQARYHGSMGGRKLNQPIVAIASTPDGGGYWLVASDGGVFSFGDGLFAGGGGYVFTFGPCSRGRGGAPVEMSRFCDWTRSRFQ